MYQKPELTVESFEVEDIITTSGATPDAPTDPDIKLDNFEADMIIGII